MRIRKGKDIKIKWAVLTDGSALPLNKEELTLELAGPNGKSQSMEFEVEGNILTATFYGKDQNYTGDYMLTLWKNKGKEGQSVVDKASAFSLVRYTPQEDLAQKHDNLSATLADLGDTSLVTIDGASETTLVCNLTGYKAVEDVSDLPMEPSTIGYLVGDNLYVYVGEGGDVRLGAYKNCGPFRGLKGDTGAQGPQGNSGYQGAAGELQVVNNLTEGGEAAALSAEQGKVLDEKKQDNLQTYHESGDYTETSIGVRNVILAQASCSDNTRSSLLLVDKDETDAPEQRVARLAVEKDGEGAFSSHVGAYGDKVQIGAPNVIINAAGGRKAATFEATVNADDNTSCVALSLSHTPDGQTDPVIDSKVGISDESIYMGTVYTEPDSSNSAYITMDSTTNELDVYAGNEKNNSCIDIDGGTMVLNATDSLQIGVGVNGGDNTGVHIEKETVRVQTADGSTEIVANDEEGILLSGKKIFMNSGENTVKDVVGTILGHTDDIQKLQDDTEDLPSIRDKVERLGNDKADKSALEATNNEVSKKQDKLNNYIERPSNGEVVIFEREKVSLEVADHENIATVGTYIDSTDGTVPIARIESTYDSGDYAYVETRGNDVNIYGDCVTVNGADLMQTIEDVATLNGTGDGSVTKKVTDEIAKVVANAPADFDTLKEIADYIASDKTNAAEINNTLTALKTRVYELGDFPTSGDAENAAKNPKISGNEAISIIHYTVNGTTDGLILQHQDIDNDYYRSLQTLFYHSRVYVRYVWFTDSTRTVLLENADDNRDWWETSISHLEYDKTTHTIKCRRIGQDVNSTKWITLPSASTSTDGLMTMAQVQSLEGKQDQLANYVEIPSGKTTIKYPNGKARVEVSNVRAALWANDDKVAIAADANGTRMLYQKTAEDASIEHRDEISIGKHDENSATHITLTSKSTTEDTGEKITNTSTIQVNPDSISMSSPEGEINDVVKEIIDKLDASAIINDLTTGGTDKALSAEMGKTLSEELASKASSESVSNLRQEVDAKAPKSGYAPDLKVNFAKELVGRGEATPEVIGGIRPTGEISIGDGNATIAKIKGNSVVWNQGAANPRSISKCTITFQDGVYMITPTAEGRTQVGIGYLDKLISNALSLTHTYLCTANVRCTNTNDVVLGQINASGNVRDQHYVSKTCSTTWQKISFIWKEGTASDGYYASSIKYTANDVSDVLYVRDWCIHDLTLMFNAGNEPKTIEEFEARKPLGVTNEYNEGTIVSYNGDALKSVGFNAYNGTYAKVIGGEEYHATGTTSISFAKELDGDATPITLDDKGKFKPEEDGYVYAEGKDIVIHLTHSYTPEHVDEYEEDVHPLPDVKSILDVNGNKLFPYGLLSAGSVYDEITETKAIKRVGVVDMGTLGWHRMRYTSGYYYFRCEYSKVAKGKAGSYSNVLCKPYINVKTDTPNLVDKSITTFSTKNLLLVRDEAYTDANSFKTANQGVLIYYELTEPIEVDLPEPLNMTYEAWDFGTEELIADSATTPLNADIVYQFNAVDRIRENSSAIDVLEGHVEEHKDDGIKLLDNGNLELTLKGETREFMPATPSGDPMHWAYVSAGAEYNDTNDYILKDAPWAALADTDEEKKVTHKAGCWYLSGVGDMTNDDIRYSYINRTLLYDLNRRASFSSDTALRTIYPVHRGSSVSGLGPTKASTLFQCTKLETCLLSNMQGVRQEDDYSLSLSASYEFYKCTALKAIGQVTPTNTDINRFAHCTSLRYIWIYALKVSLNLKDSSLISKLSVKYMIDNAAPTSAITITLHHDAYARLAEDADIVAALAAKPLVTLVSA